VVHHAPENQIVPDPIPVGREVVDPQAIVRNDQPEVVSLHPGTISIVLKLRVSVARMSVNRFATPAREAGVMLLLIAVMTVVLLVAEKRAVIVRAEAERMVIVLRSAAVVHQSVQIVDLAAIMIVAQLVAVKKVVTVLSVAERVMVIVHSAAKKVVVIARSVAEKVAVIVRSEAEKVVTTVLSAARKVVMIVRSAARKVVMIVRSAAEMVVMTVLSAAKKVVMIVLLSTVDVLATDPSVVSDVKTAVAAMTSLRSPVVEIAVFPEMMTDVLPAAGMMTTIVRHHAVMIMTVHPIPADAAMINPKEDLTAMMIVVHPAEEKMETHHAVSMIMSFRIGLNVSRSEVMIVPAQPEEVAARTLNNATNTLRRNTHPETEEEKVHRVNGMHLPDLISAERFA
jgi:hypothetical protein